MEIQPVNKPKQNEHLKNLDAENYVLGTLLHYTDQQPEVLFKLNEAGLRAVDFSFLANQLIYDTIVKGIDEGYVLDSFMLKNLLEKKDLLSQVGGVDRIVDFLNYISSISNVGFYAQKIKDLSLKRQLLDFSLKLYQDCSDQPNKKDKTASQLIDTYEKLLLDIDLYEGGYASHYQSIQDLSPKVISLIEARVSNKHSISGLPSGFTDLDDMTNGFQNSEFIVIGARPSVGKTAFALSIAEEMCVKKKIPIGFFSLEMSDQAIIDRLLASLGNIPSTKLRTGFMNAHEINSFHQVMQILQEAPFYINDTPGLNLAHLRSQARRMVMLHKVKAIFIDYMTLIQVENKDLPRHEQVAEISRSLKNLARELQIPVIALSQLTRDTQERRPTLANLRESGSIEQDADVVLFIHREKQEEQEDLVTEIILAKQRNGPVGTIKLVFIPKYTRFQSLTKMH